MEEEEEKLETTTSPTSSSSSFAVDSGHQTTVETSLLSSLLQGVNGNATHLDSQTNLDRRRFRVRVVCGILLVLFLLSLLFALCNLPEGCLSRSLRYRLAQLHSYFFFNPAYKQQKSSTGSVLTSTISSLATKSDKNAKVNPVLPPISPCCNRTGGFIFKKALLTSDFSNSPQHRGLAAPVHIVSVDKRPTRDAAEPAYFSLDFLPEPPSISPNKIHELNMAFNNVTYGI
uniref:Uncharacterized protein n=1 Tax=Ditylenchus dipsaci TaxID=166011 RepID=A0A915E750_9BILA